MLIIFCRNQFSKRLYSSVIGTCNILRQYDMTNVLSINDESAVDSAVNCLEKGRIIAVPTDTVYGLAVDSRNSEAIKNLYNIKGRDFNKPIAICVGCIEDISIWGYVDHLPSGLLEKLLPGPVTILLKRTIATSSNLNPGIDKVGIRIPANSFVRDVALKFGHAIALTSANGSSRPSTLSPFEFQDLWAGLGTVFDGGTLSYSNYSRAGSTIVDLTVPDKYSIEREGSALDNTLGILSYFF